MTAHTRARGEGCIYPYRNGRYAAYVWVTTPTGERRRKYVYGDTRTEVHARWIDLQHTAARHRLATRSPLLGEYLTWWLREVVGPFAAPKTTETYIAIVARYIAPYVGEKRVDALTVSDIRQWLHHLSTSCQCCSQGKDASRRSDQQRCCALARCCDQRLGHRTVLDARAVLRSALTEAVTDQIITHNPAAAVRLRGPRPRRMSAWSIDQARQFLASARDDHDPHYPAYLLLLCVGLRRGELLALQWTDIDLDAATVHIHSELQRVGGRLVLSDTKTLDSEAGLPLPPLCLSALRDQMPSPADALSRFVVSTRGGGPVDPRNFYRSFQNRVAQAGVPRIALHGTRHTCASLLVELDVHPRIAMQILRHAKIATTMDIYSHVATAATRTAISQIGLALSGGGSHTP